MQIWLKLTQLTEKRTFHHHVANQNANKTEST